VRIGRPMTKSGANSMMGPCVAAISMLMRSVRRPRPRSFGPLDQWQWTGSSRFPSTSRDPHDRGGARVHAPRRGRLAPIRFVGGKFWSGCHVDPRLIRPCGPRRCLVPGERAPQGGGHPRGSPRRQLLARAPRGTRSMQRAAGEDEQIQARCPCRGEGASTELRSYNRRSRSLA
jgi:hypothetical protein